MPTRQSRRLVVESLEGRLPLDATRFAVIGDYGDDSRDQADVATLVKSWDPDFIITVGDNNYDWGVAKTIDANVGKYYQEFIGDYVGQYGLGSPTNRFFPSLGNHDWGLVNPGNIDAYLDYFNLPGDGFENSSGNERYYEFRWGDLHFFALDSDSNEADGVAPDSIQAAWLRGAMQASTARWQIVFLHHPPYSSGGIYFDDPRVQWPYADWGADVVLAGHNHIYERLIIDGLNYTINGLGGRSSIYPLRNPRAGSQILFNADHGAQLFTADETRLTFEFYSVANLDEGGTLIDRVTLLHADLDGDNRVGLADVSRIQQRFGQEVGTARDGDLDGDKRVSARDLAILSYSLGATATPAVPAPAPGPRAAAANDDHSTFARRSVLRGRRIDRPAANVIPIAGDDDHDYGISTRTLLAARTPRYTNRRSSE